MTDSQKNLIELNQYYIIKSKITNLPYLSEDCGIYIIQMPSDADEFISKHENTFKDESIQLTKDIYGRQFYDLGCKKIYVKSGYSEMQVIPLEKEDAYNSKCKKLYNGKSNFAFLRLLETNKRNYLRMLKDERVFCPVKIEQRHSHQYPKISYCKGTIATDEYYLLFTTKEEFDKWNKTQNDAWNCLAVTLLTFDFVRNNIPVIINPLSIKLKITNKLYKEILKEKVKDEHI